MGRSFSSTIVMLAFVGIANGCVAGAASPERGPLASGLELSVPSWSYRGTSLAVDSESPPGILEIEVATGSVKQLSTEAYHNDPSFSPRDDTLAYVDKDRGGLWLRSRSGESREVVKGRVELPEHPWSPDGKWLVFRSEQGLSVVAPSSGEKRVLVAGEMEAAEIAPGRWTPDGAQIVGSQKKRIVTIDSRSGELRQVADLEGALPVVGPQGVLWLRAQEESGKLIRRSAGGEIKSVDLKGLIQAIDVDGARGRVLVSVAKTGVAIIDPESLSVSWLVRGGQPNALSWAPDGKRFALLRWEADAASLYVIEVP